MSRILEHAFSPSACEYWQANRIPHSPRNANTRFARWISTDSEENYQRRGNPALSLESVGYEFNSLGYRGPEFERSRGEAALMFVGDSNTLGVGMPWDRVWTSLVTKKLQEHGRAPVRQFNLGCGATGSDYVAMIVHQSVEVLKPDAVFVLWSFLSRMTWFASPRNQINFVPALTPKEYAAEHDAYRRLATEAHGFFNFVRNFTLVSARLALLGIPLYWGSLERISPRLLASYVPLDGYVGVFPKVDLARDGLHGGVQSHARFAGSVVDAVERDGLNLAPPSYDSAATGVSMQSSPASEWRRERRVAVVPRSFRLIPSNIRLRWRVRGMKRQDPFIY